MDWNAWTQLLFNVLATISSLGLLGVLAYSVRWYWHRRRWRNFARLVDQWASLTVVEPDEEML